MPEPCILGWGGGMGAQNPGSKWGGLLREQGTQRSECWLRAQGHASVRLRSLPATAATGTQPPRSSGTGMGSPCRCPWR